MEVQSKAHFRLYIQKFDHCNTLFTWSFPVASSLLLSQNPFRNLLTYVVYEWGTGHRGFTGAGSQDRFFLRKRQSLHHTLIYRAEVGVYTGLLFQALFLHVSFRMPGIGPQQLALTPCPHRELILWQMCHLHAVLRPYKTPPPSLTRHPRFCLLHFSIFILNCLSWTTYYKEKE